MHPQTDIPATAAVRGFTVPELKQLLRVGEDKIRAWIKSGELPAIDTSGARCGRPRYVVLPAGLAEFQRSRAAGKPKPARRRRKAKSTDYYAETAGA